MCEILCAIKPNGKHLQYMAEIVSFQTERITFESVFRINCSIRSYRETRPPVPRHPGPLRRRRLVRGCVQSSRVGDARQRRPNSNVMRPARQSSWPRRCASSALHVLPEAESCTALRLCASSALRAAASSLVAALCSGTGRVLCFSSNPGPALAVGQVVPPGP